MRNSKIRLMEVCGTHTMAIARAGIKKLLPSEIKLISGPGCPVCVTSQGDIDVALEIARLKDVIMTTFGDMMRVPGTQGSFQDMKRQGYDIRVVYSCLDALHIARQNPKKKIVFMGVGFETTSPTVAATILQAKKQKTQNFFILSNFKIIFPALDAIARSKSLNVDGFICPGHVSVITGSAPYEKIARRYRKPCIITGFDIADILQGIGRLVRQIKNRTYNVEIEYKRAVQSQGNRTARRIMDKVFRACDVQWRGLGLIKKSGLKLRNEYKDFDAEKKWHIEIPKKSIPKGCLCNEVIKGAKSPQECRLFKGVCSPAHPVGPCMVSSEGTCAAYYRYGE